MYIFSQFWARFRAFLHDFGEARNRGQGSQVRRSPPTGFVLSHSCRKVRGMNGAQAFLLGSAKRNCRSFATLWMTVQFLLSARAKDGAWMAAWMPPRQPVR